MNAPCHANPLHRSLDDIAAQASGRLGVCVFADTDSEPTCIHGSEAFPLQSVMKLMVGATVFDGIDHGKFGLSSEIKVTPRHVSPGPQEFAKIIVARGEYSATVEELVRRSIIDSDSTSTDVLIDYIGGIPAVQKFLQQRAISDISIDRNERELQTESVGLSWRPEFTDLEKYEASLASLAAEKRSEAWRRHSVDPRDKATPRGTVEFLRALINGKLLSPSSTTGLLAIMKQTATGSDRLRAGMPAGWTLAHKTGTGRTWNGETETTNDVGILTDPHGNRIAIAVYLAGSTASTEIQARVIAQVSSVVCRYYGTKAARKVVGTPYPIRT